MLIEETLDTANNEDYSRIFEISDKKVYCHLAWVERFQPFYNYESKKDNNLEEDFETLRLLNYLTGTVIGKEVQCRMQTRLPYTLEDTNGHSPFLNQLAKHTKIIFEDLKHSVIPYIEDIEKWGINEIDPDKEIRDDGIIVDTLGEYHPRRGFAKDGSEEPYISIDVEKIKKYPPEKINNIATIVFIHELCHALLDPNNYFRYTGADHLIEPKVKYNTLYGCCKEEAFANYLTYRIIQGFNNTKLLNDAVDFMSGQKGAYRYGYLLAKHGADITPEEWMEEKINGAFAAKEWLKSMWLALKVHKAPFANPKRNEILDLCFLTNAQIEVIAETIVSSLNVPREEVEKLRKPLVMDIGDHAIIIKIGRRKELRFPPIQAAFYLLLLNHPEGIRHNDIEKYKDEMQRCYDKISKFFPNYKKEPFQGITKDKASELASRINSHVDSVFADLPFIGGYYAISKSEGRNSIWKVEYTGTDLYPDLQKSLAIFF